MFCRCLYIFVNLSNRLRQFIFHVYIISYDSNGPLKLNGKFILVPIFQEDFWVTFDTDRQLDKHPASFMWGYVHLKLWFENKFQDTLRSRSPMRGHIERDPRARKESMLRNRSLDGLTTLTGTLSKQLGKRFSRSGQSIDENDSVV